MKEILRKMREEAERDGIPILRIEEVEQFERIVQEAAPKHALEIGTAIGYSTLRIAMVAPMAKITTIEIDSIRAMRARKYIEAAGLNERVNLLEGDARSLIKILEGKYDFLFLDAAKGQYLNCLMEALPHLSKDAIIVADNVLFRGYVESGEKPPKRYRTIVKRLREYLRFVTGAGFSTEIYRQGDGLAVTRWFGKESDRA